VKEASLEVKAPIHLGGFFIPKLPKGISPKCSIHHIGRCLVITTISPPLPSNSMKSFNDPKEFGILCGCQCRVLINNKKPPLSLKLRGGFCE